ncbi:MAG TPA: hypothetical protein VK116_19795, partial [Planctomycetota bacterium]|nr:hypothetical protein [Planctomycetota bacterium]
MSARLRSFLRAGSRLVPSILGCGLVAMLASCAQQSIQTMTAAEKAVLTTRLRKESNECFERFRRSDFQDVEALECFADRMGQTTEIHLSPAACPSCYLEYGRGLHLLGV